jgi:hypothetical protein
MTHMPFGLSPQELSIGFLVAFLGVGTLLSLLFRRRNMRVVSTRQPTQQAGQFAPPGYPSQPPPTHPYGELVGLWNFKSAVRWVGVWIGVIIGAGAVTMPLSVVLLPAGAFKNGNIAPTLLAAIASGAVGLLLIVYSVWRPSRAVQHCRVDERLAVTVMRGGREIPLDLNHYRYVRMHVTTERGGWNRASMLVIQRDRRPGVGALVSSILFPRVDDGRIVLFYYKWWTADGAYIPYTVLDDFFRDVCRRAGHEPRFMDRFWILGEQPWEVRPD